MIYPINISPLLNLIKKLNLEVSVMKKLYIYAFLVVEFFYDYLISHIFLD